MQQLKNLPTAAKVAIPAILLALVLAIVVMGTSGPKMVEVYSTSDADMLQAMEWKLKTEKIKPVHERKDGQWIIKVTQANEASAQAAINGSSLTSRMSQDSSDKCKEPGSFSNMKQQQRYDECAAEQKIYDALVRESGVLQAAVSVVTEDSGELVGSDKQSSVTAQLFLDPHASEPIDAGALAAEVANMVPGGSVDRVILKDANSPNGATLWNRNSGASGSSATPGACTNPTSDTVDITTMEQIVSTCYESQIRQKIAAIIGGTDHVRVAVATKLSPSARSVTSTTVTDGATLASSKDSTMAGGTMSNNEQETRQPGTRRVDSTTIAGAIQRMAISVTIDSKFSNAQKEKAVRSILNAYVDPRRGDPAPSVISVGFGTPAATTSSTDSAAGGQAAGGAAGAPASNAPSSNLTLDTSSSSSPTGLIIIGGVVIAALFGALLMMWQRARTESQRRRAVEQEFAREQSMFGAFAQQNPDDLADELNRLLGASGPGVGAGR